MVIHGYIFTQFFQKDGLASDIVMRILEDSDGNLWCAVFGGLSVYDIRTGGIKSYDKGDGMPFTDYSNLGRNAAKAPNSSGFPSLFNGISFFHWESIVSGEVPALLAWISARFRTRLV